MLHAQQPWLYISVTTGTIRFGTLSAFKVGVVVALSVCASVLYNNKYTVFEPYLPAHLFFKEFCFEYGVWTGEI